MKSEKVLARQLEDCISRARKYHSNIQHLRKDNIKLKQKIYKMEQVNGTSAKKP